MLRLSEGSQYLTEGPQVSILNWFLMAFMAEKSFHEDTLVNAWYCKILADSTLLESALSSHH